jgi:hypothetical protein
MIGTLPVITFYAGNGMRLQSFIPEVKNGGARSWLILALARNG